MKSALETLNPTRVKMTVEVPYEELKPSLDAAYKTIGQQIQVPGFRKGKVPARIIDQRVGRGAVLQEAVNEALPKFYGQAIDENDVRPLGQPDVDVTEVPAEEGQELKFTAEVDVRPEITLPDYAGHHRRGRRRRGERRGRRRAASRRCAQRFGTLKGVERPAQDGDFVSIDLTATIDDEEIDTVTGVSYEVGSKNMIEGIDEALVGMKAGETKEFSAPLAGGDHEGRDADCVVTVQSVKERELPELDDDFAQLASEFDTLDELRADVVKQAEQAKRFEQGVQARDQMLEQLLEAVEVPVPDGIVEAEVHSHLEGESRLEDDEHRAEVAESTRKALKAQLLLDAIVEKEEITVEQPELIEYIVMSAQQYGMDPNQFAQAIDEQGQVPAMVAEVAAARRWPTCSSRRRSSTPTATASTSTRSSPPAPRTWRSSRSSPTPRTPWTPWMPRTLWRATTSRAWSWTTRPRRRRPPRPVRRRLGTTRPALSVGPASDGRFRTSGPSPRWRVDPKADDAPLPPGPGARHGAARRDGRSRCPERSRRGAATADPRPGPAATPSAMPAAGTFYPTAPVRVLGSPTGGYAVSPGSSASGSPPPAGRACPRPGYRRSWSTSWSLPVRQTCGWASPRREGCRPRRSSRSPPAPPPPPW